MANATDPAAGWRATLLAPRAAALARAGRYAEAKEWLLLLLATDPQPRLHCLLGKVHAQLGEVDDSARQFEAALAADPGCREAAAGLVALRRKAPTVALRQVRLWQAATAVVSVALLALVVGSREHAPSRVARLDGSSDTLAAVQRELGEQRALLERLLDARSAPPPVDEASLGALSRFLTQLADVRSIATLTVHPVAGRDGMVVRVAGDVPTEHLRVAIIAMAEREPGLTVDTGSVTVSHRYEVRGDDTLQRIAAKVYGTTRRWHDLHAANRGELPDPNVIRTGTTIVVP